MGELITRAMWGARPPKRVSLMSRSDGLAWHDVGVGKSLGPLLVAGDREAVSAMLRNMQNMHMDTNYLQKGGGSDIAYSWIVSQRGDIYEGRGWGVSGGHTMGANSTCHGVLFIIGDGNTEEPTPAAQEAAQWLITEHAHRFGDGWELGHREVAGNPSGTSCPGDGILAVVHAGFPAGGGHEPSPPSPVKDEDMAKIGRCVRDSDGAQFMVEVRDDNSVWAKWASKGEPLWQSGWVNVQHLGAPVLDIPVEHAVPYVHDERLHVELVNDTLKAARLIGSNTYGWPTGWDKNLYPCTAAG